MNTEKKLLDKTRIKFKIDHKITSLGDILFICLAQGITGIDSSTVYIDNNKEQCHNLAARSAQDMFYIIREYKNDLPGNEFYKILNKIPVKYISSWYCEDVEKIVYSYGYCTIKELRKYFDENPLIKF